MVLSMAALWLGIPLLSETGQPLADWLGPVFANADLHFVTPASQEMGLPTLLLGIGAYAAWLLERLRSGQANAHGSDSSRNRLTIFLAEGWYLERACGYFIARPMRSLSDFFASKLPEMMSRSDRGMARITLLATLAVAGSIILLTAMA